MIKITISIVVFDADGTIFDSMPLYTELFSSILEKEYQIPVADSSSYYTSSAGMPLNKQLEAILVKHRKPLDMIQHMADEFFNNAAKKIPDVFPDVMSALKELSDYKIIISTGTRQDILDKRVKCHKLNKYLDKWFGINGFKRKEDHFNEIKKLYSTSEKGFRESVAFVGDGKPDMELAQKFGIIGIGRIGTTDARGLKKAGARYTVNTLLEIKGILKSEK